MPEGAVPRPRLTRRGIDGHGFIQVDHGFAEAGNAINFDAHALRAVQANRMYIEDDVEDVRERVIERAREMFHNGDVEDAQVYLCIEGGLTERQARERLEEWANQQPTMQQKINRYLRGEKVEGINDQVVEDYYLEEKKKRFLKRNERDRLHKPVGDGDKPTSSVKLDDLVPDVEVQEEPEECPI